MSNQTIYSCSHCGSQYQKWLGKCEECHKWNTISEEENNSKESVFGNQSNKNSITENSSKIEIINLKQDIKNTERFSTGINELDSVLGGGLVCGSAILIGGEPGIGKSTLLLQISSQLAKKKLQTLYLSGEESAEQIHIRAKRLNSLDAEISIISTGDIISSIKKIEKEKLSPSCIIIDSIQTAYLNHIESNPGTITQIRSVAFEMIKYCKKKKITLIIVGHITKDGAIGGPKILEHMVDCVLYFEDSLNRYFKILRSTKNRFGSTGEIGIFTMNESGLNELSDPSSIFLNEENGKNLFVTVEGTRPIATEIEVLISKTFFPSPRRNTIGIDSARLAMIIAILETKCNMTLYDKDVYLSVASGLKISESGTDLIIAFSIMCAYLKKKNTYNIGVLGEIGLSGKLRSIALIEKRVSELIKMGCEKILIPFSSKKIVSVKSDKFIFLSDIHDLFSFVKSMQNANANI